MKDDRPTDREHVDYNLQQFKQAAFDAGIPYLAILHLPEGGWLIGEWGLSQGELLRLIRRLKEEFAYEYTWEEVADAPPTVDTEPDQDQPESNTYGPPCSKTTGERQSPCLLWEGHEGECSVLTKWTLGPTRLIKVTKDVDGFYREVPEDEIDAWINQRLYMSVMGILQGMLAATLAAVVIGTIIYLLSA